MPGTIKIWWHDGAVKDVRHHDIPVVNEPELSFETVAVDVLPVVSAPAPAGASIAVVECDVDVRYRVRKPGDLSQASAFSSKPIRGLTLITESIGVQPGDSISFIEV